MNDFLLFRSIKNNPSNILFLTCFPTAMNANFTPFPLSLPVGVGHWLIFTLTSNSYKKARKHRHVNLQITSVKEEEESGR